MSDIEKDAYAVLLPAFENVDFGEDSHSFFRNGGVASLLGCSRQEYVARRMSMDRQGHETAELLRQYSLRALDLTSGVLVAVDYEIGGVHRLHALGKNLGHPRDVLEMTYDEVCQFGVDAANSAKSCGINFFLSPVVDLVAGSNPWLRNRTFSVDPTIVSHVACAFITGVQSEGVVATAKHFPGHPHVPLDPFESSTTSVEASMEELRANLSCFDAVIHVGVKAIMTGPIPVNAIDPGQPSSTSSKTIGILRHDHNFSGLIVSDDIDLPGTLRGRTVPDAVVDALRAGVDLVLLASGPQVDLVARHVVKAVSQGSLDKAALHQAASNVRSLASTTWQTSGRR